MTNIYLTRHGKKIKCYRVREAFLVNGFRVLIDDYIYGKKDCAIVGDDGKSDRIFETEEEAVKLILLHIYKLINIGYIDDYEVIKI